MKYIDINIRNREFFSNHLRIDARVNILAKIQNSFLTDIPAKPYFFLDFCGVFCVSARGVRSF